MLKNIFFKKIKRGFTQHHFYLKGGAGFTLVEMLVVIAVMGVLASIIIVAVSEPREKAKIAKGLQFGASIYHALGPDLVGEWKFEETGDNTCVGGTSGYDDFCDNSGNNNHGQNYGGVNRSFNDEIPQLGQKTDFNGASNYILVSSNNTLDITDVITIEGWVKTNNDANGWVLLFRGLAASPVYSLYVSSSNALIFSLRGLDPISFNCGAGSGNLFNDGKWHHLVATWSYGTKRKIFLDGKEICPEEANVPTGNITNLPRSISIGAGMGTALNGFLDEVRLYSASLTSAQIQQLYVEGAKKRGLLAQE